MKKMERLMIKLYGHLVLIFLMTREELTGRYSALKYSVNMKRGRS